MNMQGSANAIMKRNSFGELPKKVGEMRIDYRGLREGRLIQALPFMSLSIEQEPIAGSSPNVPHTLRQVGIREQNGNNQVQATMHPRYFRR